MFAIPSAPLKTQSGSAACANAQALLSCEVTVKMDLGSEWPKNRWLEVDQVREYQTFRNLAWLTERVKGINNEVDQWHDVTIDDDHTICNRCAPAPPVIRWVRTDKKFLAVEDSIQAGKYEHALKNRPSPFVTHVKFDDSANKCLIRIGVNLTSLVHRAVSRLPTARRNELPRASWKLNTRFIPQATIDLAKFSLLSNRPDPQASQPPHFVRKYPLRPEQLRSLDWMVRQEASNCPMFPEEEVAEAVLPTLGWRAEGRAQRPVRVRGGVLADQVG